MLDYEQCKSKRPDRKYSQCIKRKGHANNRRSLCVETQQTALPRPIRLDFSNELDADVFLLAAVKAL